MRPKHFWIDLLDSDVNGVFQDQQPNTTVTLNGAEATADNARAYVRETEFSRRGPGKGATGNIENHATRWQNSSQPPMWGRSLILDSGADWSGVTFTVVGTDQDNRPQEVSYIGPNATTDTGSQFWQTISAITTSGTVGTNIDGGFSDLLASPTIPLSWYYDVGTRVVVNITNTINYTVQETFDPINDPEFMSSLGTRGAAQIGAVGWSNYASIHWVDLQAAGTSDSANAASVGATAIRITVASYTDSAEIDVHIIPEGN